MSKMPTLDDLDLNADAIYAALVHVRDFLNTRQGEAEYQEALETAGDSFFAQWHDVVASHPGVTMYAIPKIHITPELVESIFPGEPESVELGLKIAEFVLAPRIGPKMAEQFMVNSEGGSDAIREAVTRFVGDRAH